MWLSHMERRLKYLVRDILVSFEDPETRPGFVVLKNVQYELVIGRPTFKRTGGVLDFKVEEVRLLYHN